MKISIYNFSISLKCLQVGITLFDGSGQTRPKYSK